MWCMKCNNDLMKCECPDLLERMTGCSKVVFPPEVIRRALELQGMKELEQIGNDTIDDNKGR